MNTVRIPREPIVVGRGPMRANVRPVAVSAALCVAVFVCCFAIGRAERPAGAPTEKLLPSLPAASAGAAIPLALSSAPTLERETIRVVIPRKVSSGPVTAPSATTAHAATQELVATTPTVPTSTAITPVKTTPVLTSPAKSAPAAPPRSTGQSSAGETKSTSSGASSGSQRPAAKSETSSGTSFDSSG
jgi:hypothetical protein